jgi:hypothetical protein
MISGRVQYLRGYVRAEPNTAHLLRQALLSPLGTVVLMDEVYPG